MDEVIYSASGPPSCMASMDEVIYSAPAYCQRPSPTSPSRRLQDGPRQLFQTYGFVAREASEEDEESAAADSAQKWQQLLQQQQQPRRTPPWLLQPPAAASSNKSCYSLD